MLKKAQDDEIVMSLVDLALDRSADEREAYLQSVCAGEPELYREVRKYVQWEERMDGFLLEALFSTISNEHPFAPDDLLDGRFRIVREVAQGGMGIVYEAMDEKLERHIALKCGKIGFRKRLPPEVRNATTISHPNVCKTFEIHTASTDVGEVDFLTMEFLDGETLAERLRLGPSLPEPEGRSVALQLCAGLAEAHRNHVVHGDLKTGNVILAAWPEGGIRAVITDFGLARKPDSGQRTAQSSVRGGTPDYMAPELWKGEEPSPASDVYALGVIIYQLVAGRTPYTAETSWQDRLSMRPPAVASAWNGVISRCLDPDPQNRFQNAQEVARALQPSHVRRWLTIAGAAAVVVVAATAAVTYRSAVPRESVTLAMLPFQADAQTAPLAEKLFQAANGQLAQLKGSGSVRFTVVPGANIERERADTAEKAQLRAGATHVLYATMIGRGEKTAVHAYLEDTRSHARLKDWNAEYAAGELKYLPTALAGVVTGALRIPPPATPHVTAAARQDYQNGIAAVRFDTGVDAALDSLRKAVTEDPDSPLTQAALAEAEWFKYYLTKDQSWLDQSAESARQAGIRNPDSAEVLRIMGILDAKASRYELAEAEYRRAIELEPGNGDAYRRLGLVLEQSNHADEALAEYRKALEADPGYYRTYSDMGSFYIGRGNYDEAARYLRKGVELAPKEPNVHYALGVTYLELQRFPDAEMELRTAVNLGNTSAALQTLGVVLMYEGRDRDALPYFREALTRGPELVPLWLNLGIAYRRLNLKSESQHANRQGLELAEKEMARDPRNGTVRSHLALLCAESGDRTRAESEIAQALRLSPDDADILWAAAVTYEALGERDRTLAVLSNSPVGVLADLGHWPDAAELQRDPQFIRLLASHQLK